VLVTVILLLVPAATVQASPSLAVHFDVPTAFGPGGTGPTGGPFTASGPAVDAGLMCPAGDTIDVASGVAGYRSPAGVNFRVVKHFTCTDGSGEFWVKLQVRIDSKGDNFVWVIVDGTDAYSRLRGTGWGYGLPIIENGVFDVYDGRVHVD
jgi:hypothetical protein